MPLIGLEETTLYRYKVGESVIVTCMIEDSANPSTLPITSANIWISIQKESTEKWLNFQTGEFDGDDYDSSAYKQLLTNMSDGTYEFNFDQDTYNEEDPEAYVMQYTTDYSFEYSSSTSRDVYYFYAS